MTTKDLLQKLLIDKTSRQVRLNTISQQLEELDLNLFGSKIGRWFGSTYLTTKRIITLLLGLAFVGLSLALIFYPEVLFEIKALKIKRKVDNENFYLSMRVIATLLLILGSFFLYISRLTQKMRSKNRKISEAQSLTRSIILDFQEEIRNSELEAQIIRGIVNEDR
jgi:heme/copper-type cytochrome/quinol oxidase subunit 3